MSCCLQVWPLMSEDDEASILCNSFEYWRELKSINTVSRATTQATRQTQKKKPTLFWLKNIFFARFSCKKNRPFLCAILLRWFCYVYLRLAQENTICKPSGCVTACAWLRISVHLRSCAAPTNPDEWFAPYCKKKVGSSVWDLEPPT